jgi:DNA-binding LytR/AlgR family response regulator
MSDPQDRATSFAGALVAAAIAAPTLLGIYPVRLALIGLGFGPAAWVAISWQLASVVTWTLMAIPLLEILRRRTDANVVTGRPALTLRDDGPAIWAPCLLAIAAHAVAIAAASGILILGRGRPAPANLTVDAVLLYAPMNVMTLIGLIGAAIVAAEHRARLRETALRLDLERQLHDARTQVLTALAELNGPENVPAAIAMTDPLERIAVSIGNRTTVISVDEIDWIEARSYYARLHVGARHFLIRQSMNALEERLDPKRFARIHRSTIVRLDRVTELQPLDRRSYVVVLRDGRRLMMSRRRRRLLDYLLP